MIVEGGFAWVPALAWRMDRHWARIRDEVPHLSRTPSEYIRENIWFTTQPMEEPENPGICARSSTGSAGTASCSPPTTRIGTWTSPELGFKLRMTQDERQLIYRDNARAVYGLH